MLKLTDYLLGHAENHGVTIIFTTQFCYLYFSFLPLHLLLFRGGCTS